MKISPLAQGTGVPSASSSSLGQTATPEKLLRAKAIALGQEPSPESTGDPQADRARESVRKIKMRTQVSTHRDDPLLTEMPIDQIESPTSDTIEDASEPEETRPLSPQFAALAKAKRSLQVKERELAQREEALKSQSPAGSDDFAARLKANPLSVLQEAGVTYDQLTEALLNNQTSPELQTLKAELKALKEELNSQFVTRDQQAEQQVLADMKREADKITSQGDDFEAIREARAQQHVVDLIHQTWKKTGEVLDVTTAANLVENQLIEDALPFAKIKKLQSRLNPEATETQIAPPQAIKPNTKIMRTLTNRDSASPVLDRRARALAAFRGTLK